MRVLKCDKCGCHIPAEKVFKRINRIQKEEMISDEEVEKAKRKIKQGNPYAKCHNPNCSGFLKPVDEGEVQADLSDFKKQKQKSEEK